MSIGRNRMMFEASRDDWCRPEPVIQQAQRIDCPARQMLLIEIFHAVLLSALLFRAGTAPFTESFDWQSAIVLWAVIAVYGAVLVGYFRSKLACIWISIVPPAAIFFWTAPNVIYNAWEFSVGAPPYQDSPGTFIIVAIVAMVLTIPSGLVLGAYWWNRHKLFTTALRADA